MLISFEDFNLNSINLTKIDKEFLNKENIINILERYIKEK